MPSRNRACPFGHWPYRARGTQSRMIQGRRDACVSTRMRAQHGRRECNVVLDKLRPREADRLSRRRAALTLGAGVAAMALVAGTIVALVAPQVVVGTTPTVADSTCQDAWTGAAGTTDWNTATNWSTGIPNSTSIHACVTGHATVLLTGVSLSVGQLTISAGSSLTIGAGATGPTAATLRRVVRRGERRDAERRPRDRRRRTDARRCGDQHGKPHRGRHRHRRRDRLQHPDQ